MHGRVGKFERKWRLVGNGQALKFQFSHHSNWRCSTYQILLIIANIDCFLFRADCK